MEKRKFIIDCDTGTDDAQAILMALSHDDVEVLAITTLYGNSTLENTSYNTLKVLQVINRLDIPVYPGCNMSLLGKPSNCDGFHGDDGLGDIEEDNPPDRGLLKTEHAANALVRIISENPGEVTLVATGPLTNLAVALMLDPGLGSKIHACCIMGGNIYGHGNVTIAQEFNFFSDQEAANSVLNNLGCPITLVPLETCTDSAFSWEWYESFISTNTTEGRFVKRVEEKMVSLSKGRKEEMYYAMWDQLAMAVALNPQIAIESKCLYATVELHGGLTRGQVVVDWLSKLNRKPNVTLLTKVNVKLFEQMLYKAIGVKN